MITSLVEGFRALMLSRQIPSPETIITDTVKPQRFHIDGDKKGSKNGWYILYTDFPPAGAFGCWKRGIRYNFCPALQPNDTNAFIQQSVRIDFIKRQITREQEKLAAISLWEQATPATNGCRYLLKKKVKSHGLRYYKNSLFVPVMDADGLVHGVQRIWSDGTKRFTPGTDKPGHFFLIGNPGNTILIAEGYATAATLHESTGYAAIVAFDAGNLFSAAVAIRDRHRTALIILCADNDQWTDGNPGLTAATNAAKAINGLLAVPVFRDITAKPTDFNDLCTLEGAEAVRLQVAAALGKEHV